MEATQHDLVLSKRPRRLRRSEGIRDLVQETHLRTGDLIVPLFVVEGTAQKQAIPKFPGIFRFSIDVLLKEAENLHKQGILAVALFPMMDASLKDSIGSMAQREDCILNRAIAALKRRLPNLLLISDVALDPYTSHGHDGIVNEKGEVLNDETVEYLVQMALLQARAGADFVAPSDMMDGRVRAMRDALDREGFSQVGILSYAAKFASKLYGPFREAVQSSLQFGDKKGYQLNPANRREALLEASLDENEGADLLLVKPALYYLDVLSALKAQSRVPVGAYHVSGEYAMVMAAHEQGVLDAPAVFWEALLSIKRAGADFIITYAYPQIAHYLAKNFT